METWMVAALALLVNIGLSYGAAKYATGAKDREISQLRKEVDELKARVEDQATSGDVDRVIERLDAWAKAIEADVRGVRGLLAQLVAGEKPTVAAILAGAK